MGYTFFYKFWGGFVTSFFFFFIGDDDVGDFGKEFMERSISGLFWGIF